MQSDEHTQESTDWWQRFLISLSKKTNGKENPKRLRQALRDVHLKPSIYFLFGIHGNILFPDAGYCEFDDPEAAFNHLKKWCDLNQEWRDSTPKKPQGFPAACEIGICSLEELAKEYPVWDIIRDSEIEVVNPLYGQPYLRQIGEESNYRQFEWGVRRLRAQQIDVPIYASSEHALHPQLPQLLEIFGIPGAIVAVRLAGGAPTSWTPKVIWQGLDGTKVAALVSQTGLPNGQIWHGKFFEELPSLIFAAVSRPDLEDCVFFNLEDFANPMPGLTELLPNLKEFRKSDIHFAPLSEVLKNPEIPTEKTVQWRLDEFSIKPMVSKLIAKARVCEDRLVLTEMVSFLWDQANFPPLAEIFEEAWKKLLLAQNHDAYVVPFTTPGMYSEMQGISIKKEWEIEETIEEYCVNLLDAVHKRLDEYFPKFDTEMTGYFNALWERTEIIDGNRVSLPALGYTTHKSPWSSELHIEEISKTQIRIGAYDIILPEYERVEKCENQGQWKIAGDFGELCVLDKESRVELEFTLANEQNFGLKKEGELWTTYPFGAEPSGEHFGHALRFLWDSAGTVCINSGTPYYEVKEDRVYLKIPRGKHTFALARATCIEEAYQRAWEFFYPALGITLPPDALAQWHTFEITFNDSLPLSFGRKGESWMIRMLTLGKKLPHGTALHPIRSEFGDRENSQRAWQICHFQWKTDLKKDS